MTIGAVSVLVCCYNGARFIPSCFDSLLHQTYKRLEIIFIDDGSTDGSYDLARDYTERFAEEGISLVCLKQENLGVGYACANGLLHAHGEFISTFDVDDYLYPESIEQRVLFLNTHPDFTVVRTNGYKINKDGQKNIFVTTSPEKTKEDIFEDLLLGRTNNWPGSYLVRAEALWRAFPDHRVPGSRYGQNLQILLPAAWGNKAGFIDEPLMEYRFNPRSITNHKTDFASSHDRYLGFWQIRKDILFAMEIDSPDLRNKMTVVYGRILMDLCLAHNEQKRFLSIYDSTAAVKSPAALYKYHYYLYSGKKARAFLFRCLNFLQNHLG